jgi:hypothetical protein
MRSDEGLVTSIGSMSAPGPTPPGSVDGGGGGNGGGRSGPSVSPSVSVSGNTTSVVSLGKIVVIIGGIGVGPVVEFDGGITGDVSVASPVMPVVDGRLRRSRPAGRKRPPAPRASSKPSACRNLATTAAPGSPIAQRAGTSL